MAKSDNPKRSGNLYDKVIQENLSAMIGAIVQKHLRIDAEHIKPITLNLQRTIERKPDYLAEIKDRQGHRFLLHLEFQTKNDQDMVFRMNEYQALILRKTHSPVLQYIIYMGSEDFRMETEFAHPDYTYRCRSWDISRVSYQTFIASDIPEEIMLAICADYGGEPSTEVIRKILRQIKSVSRHERSLLKYINQLTILSNMRKLEQEIITETRAMNITGRIEEFELYQMGQREGKKEDIRALLKSGLLTPEQIAQTLEVPLDYVNQLQQEL